jgi:hypothetical protein
MAAEYTEPAPVGVKPMAAWRVIATEGRPKSWSRSGLTRFAPAEQDIQETHEGQLLRSGPGPGGMRRGGRPGR